MIMVLFIAYYFLTQVGISADSSAVQQAVNIEKEAKRVLIQKCGDCHSVPDVRDFSLKTWEESLQRMKGKAQLTDHEYQLLREFISKAATTK